VLCRAAGARLLRRRIAYGATMGSQFGHDIGFRCPYCEAGYVVSYIKLPIADSVSYYCECCKQECANGIQPCNHAIGSSNEPTENTITLSASRGRSGTCDENPSHHCVGDSCAQYRERRLCEEALKGEVVTVDKASKKIGIKLSGTVG